MNDHAPQSSQPLRPDDHSGALIRLSSDSWEAGRTAGFAWAEDEARRGYVHPVSHVPNARIVIEHARHAFGGMTHGRPRAFIRGFVQGVSEYWRSHGSRSS